MKNNCALYIILVLFSACAVMAQTTYQVTTVPTSVINTGRAEVLGGIRITAENAGPTVASTIQYTYLGVACDNDNSFNSGVTLTVTAPFTTGVNTNIQSVTNTSFGCVVAVTVASGLATTAGTSYIEVDGVRGRVDMLGGIGNVGNNINGSLSATPSTSSLFTVPNQGVVGITVVGLFVNSVTTGTVLQCIGTASPEPKIRLQEGFNGAFVQHVVTAVGSALPANGRPVYGGTSNTQIHLHVANQPAGVSLAWPAAVTSQLNGGVYMAGVAGSELQYLASSTATDIVYEYACGDQATCDINTEVFNIVPVLTATPMAAFGTATVGINLYPPLIQGDAGTITTPPFGAFGEPRPRFNDPLRGPFNIAISAPCPSKRRGQLISD